MSDSIDLKVRLGVESSTASQQIKAFTSELKTLEKEIKSLDTGTNNFSTNMSNIAKKTDLTKEKIEGITYKLDAYNKKLDEAKIRLQKAQDNMDKLGKRTKENGKAWDSANKELNNAQTHYNNMNQKLRETEIELSNANRELTVLKQTMAKMPYENLSKGLDKVSGGLKNISQATAPLSIGLATAFGGAVKTTIDFEKAMAEVGAIANASAEDLQRMSDKAREIGSNTQLSASEGAEAMKLLAQAGYDVDKSIKTVDSTVNLSIASNIELAESTSILTSIMSAFGLSAENAVHVTDVLSKTASSSNTNVSELGEAFKNVAPTAAALGYSVDDVSIVLGTMANQAISGSEAGNALKSILASLTKPTKNAKAIMEEYGISLQDANGKTLPLIDLVKNLRDKFGDLSETQQAQIASTIVGKQQMSKFLAIINGSDEQFNNLTKAIDNCEGTTEKMRETMEATAQGSIKEMLSKIEEMSIQIGQKLLPHVVTIIEKISNLVDWFNNLDDSTQDLIINIGLFGVALSPISGLLGNLTGGLSKLVSHIGNVASKSVNASDAIITIGESSGLATKALVGSGGLVSSLGTLITTLGAIGTGVAVAGAVAALAGLGYGIYNVYKESQNVADNTDESTKRMTESHDLMAQKITEKYKEIEGSMKKFRSDGLTDLTNAFKNSKDGAELDLTEFKNMCDTKLNEARVSITENAKELTSGLEFLNTDMATIFSAEDLGNIQDEWSKEMTTNLEESYNALTETINNKDSIIEGLMVEHGYDYETAYSEWQGRVYDNYTTFCDDLIEAQTGYQEESMGSLKNFLMQQSIAEAGGATNAIVKLREQNDEKIKEINSGYELALASIAQGETQINGIYFDSAQEAMDYADLVRDYRVAQQQITGEEEVKALAAIALQEGEITQERYNQIVDSSDKKIAVLQSEADAMGTIMQSAEENVSGAWNNVWKAIDQAESEGIPKSITRNQEFITTLEECFNNGASMSDALVAAYDKVVGASQNTSNSVQIDFQNMDSGTQASLNNVVTYMNDLGYSMEDAVKEVNGMQGSTKISVDQVVEYFRWLARDGGQSLDLASKDMENTGDSAYTMRDNIKEATSGTSTNIRNLKGNLSSDLIDIQDEFGYTGEDAGTMSNDVDSASRDSASSARYMQNEMQRYLNLTSHNFFSTEKDVASSTSGMKSDIGSVKGKEVEVKANFTESGYSSLWGKISSLITSPKTFSFKSLFTSEGKDAGVQPISFGDVYTEDIYGMKDAGVKTISLSTFADEGVSAYATKDTTASNLVSNSVSNYNSYSYSSILSRNNSNNQLLNMMKNMMDNMNEDSGININLNIEHMNGNEQDVDKLIKMISDRINMTKKRW